MSNDNKIKNRFDIKPEISSNANKGVLVETLD